MYLYEFEDSLVYRASSRTSKAVNTEKPNQTKTKITNSKQTNKKRLKQKQRTNKTKTWKFHYSTIHWPRKSTTYYGCEVFIYSLHTNTNTTLSSLMHIWYSWCQYHYNTADLCISWHYKRNSERISSAAPQGHLSNYYPSLSPMSVRVCVCVCVCV